MKLSVIIVNYNVEHFLEQCLHAVRKALKNIRGEVFVVDNSSVDGSVAMLKEKFPDVNLVLNRKNLGFSKANNQAIRAAKGEYLLLLNPDTVVEEDTFEKCLQFMDAHPDAGGLGVKMLDGKGNFLPESKRGLPTPSVAFYKICGLARLFPRSRAFGKYHLGYLDKDKVHAVDVLAGAFMMLRRSVLDKTGLLDEDFFMYGEDIDLSYRITKAGYKNYYFPGTRIIHYKGESTRKSSVNYVLVFYKAMVIFAQKHFSQSNASLFSFLINLAIYLRAGASIAKRFIQKTFLPLVDAGVILGGLLFIKDYYEHNVKFVSGGSYLPVLVWIAFPSYIFMWLLSVYLSGGYDRPIRLSKITRGVFIGTGIILIIYSLLPESYRFSRALILLGAAWTLASLLASRMILHFLKLRNFALDGSENKRIAIAGSREECERIHSLIRQTSLRTSFIGFVDPSDSSNGSKSLFVGSLSQLAEIINIYKIDEVIFSARDLPAQRIIDQMLQLGRTNVDYKIAPPESLSVIGSNSIDTSGDLYVIDINSVTKPVNRRNKRLVDLVAAFFLLIASPVLVFAMKKPGRFIANTFAVLFGFRSWIGTRESPNLPPLKKGVLRPADILSPKGITPETEERLDLLYVKDYRVWNDVNIIIKGFRKLGNR